MMNGSSIGMNGWGYGLMGVSMVLFWALVVLAIVALVRYVGGHDRQPSGTRPVHRTPEQILAERFAHGDIGDEEFLQRAKTLRRHLDP
jgi:putative membrane protein